MGSHLVILADGSPEAAALAKWVHRNLPVKSVLETASPDVLSRLFETRQRSGTEQVLVLTSASPPADPRTVAALARATEWLEGMDEISIRVHGAERIEARRAALDPPDDILYEFLTRLGARVPKSQTRVGRPRGRDPFKGSGFDVCVCLLLSSKRYWVERELASATRRAPSQIHYVLAELERRGHLLRSGEGVRARSAITLREDLLSSWRGRVGAHRETHWFLKKGKSSPEKSLLRAARSADVLVLAAGPSASTGATGLVGAPHFYVPIESMDSLSSQLEASTSAAGDIACWVAPERAVFLEPRRVEGRLATNRVVTYLDLAIMGSERALDAAHAVWEAEE